MKNRLYQSLFLGITSAIAASASYALITPQNETQASMENLAPTIALPSLYETTANFLGQTAELEKPVRQRSIEHKILPAQTLSSIFPLYKINSATLEKITKSNDIGAQFAKLTVNKILMIELDETYQLQQLSYKQDIVNTIIATRNGDSFDVRKESRPLKQHEALAKGTIKTSLSADGAKAGLSVGIINKLADKIFAWDIDFNKDLQPNDKFTVIYEETLVEGERVKTGEVLAAEFVISGKSYSAIRYKDKEGNVEYYSPQGKNVARRLRKTFLRSPIAFARISSHFNLHRKHPVLNRIRAHKGVDYAARSGTPIKSTGDGKIIFRGRKGGYGNVVIVQHSKKYKSLYAHMSKFNGKYKLGSTIKQGTVVGYVGKTGLATGAHLHYEFLVNGVHKNPLTVKLPRTQIKSNNVFIARFKKQAQPYVDQLNSAMSDTAKINVNKLFSKKTKKL
ncbi:MAG: peptidoglycan DD-metalloendopeptidase family protein [Methylococcales bacterium]|nr:peptidoglycan DD-metalloendopeptidase family protein [Methylococcales bacterium]